MLSLRWAGSLLLLAFLLPLVATKSTAADAPAAATGEENLLMLHNGGVAVGILPQVGGRVMVFRTDAGANVLNGDPSLWKAPTPDERAAWEWKWKQYFGESVWS